MEQNGKKEQIKEAAVTREMLACTVGSGSLQVLATPVVAALMENAACLLAQNYVEQGCTTVGTEISITHTSPTPLHAKVWAKAELVKTDGRKFTFTVTAYDESGVIAAGSHTRFSVKADSFQKKADAKFDNM